MYMILVDQNQPDAINARSVDHLRNCVRTAATVVTSASTMHANDTHEQQLESWDLTSEFGWLSGLDNTHSSLTLDWVANQRQDSGSSPTLAANLGRVPEDTSTVNATPDNGRLVHSQDDEEDHGPTTVESIDSDAAPIVAPGEKKRRSFSLTKLFSSRSKTVSPGGRSSRSQLCMDDLKISAAGEIRMKICFVGDGACGKTCFLM